MKTKSFVAVVIAVLFLASATVFLPAGVIRGWLAVLDFVVVPGLIYAQLLAGDWPWLERIILGLLLGLVIDPFLLLGLARLHVGLTVPHITALFTTLSLAGLGLLAWRSQIVR